MRALLLVSVLSASSVVYGAADMKLTDPAIPIAERVKHAKALGNDKSTKALDTLLAGLDIRNDELHAAIVESLKQHKGDVVLVQRAADAKLPAAQRALAFAGLRVLKPAAAAPQLATLLDAAKEKDAAVRADAAHTLCVFGAAAAEAKLVEAVAKDPSKDVRYYAAVALGELKTKAAKDAVAARLKVEPDFAVQDALEQAQTKQARP